VAREHGAHHLIDSRAEDVRARLKELTAPGRRRRLRSVGGALFEASLRTMAPDGRTW